MQVRKEELDIEVHGGIMIRQITRIFAVIALFFFGLACGIPVAFGEEKTVPAVQAPQPTVPEAFTILGQFVRVANNNEGFATLGYRTAQESIGQDWVLLDVGITVLEGTKDFSLKRENLTLKTPDGTIIPLASVQDFKKAGSCSNLIKRDNKFNDSINYFPSSVSHGCVIGFFGAPGKISYDQVELTSNRACMGRLFFQVPGGIVTGQYWLYIQFANSQLQVPFRILTKEERDMFSKNWQEIKKAFDDSMKQ